jgi:2-oxoglutarate ferredoxin oxidoreductase subunit alpha
LASNHHEQLEKRQRKLDVFDYGQLACRSKGSGSIAILCWGSAYGACNDARKRLAAAGINIRVIAPRLLAPLPVDAIRAALDGVGQVLVVEQSHSGQFSGYLRAKIHGLEAELMARPGPQPLRAAQIVERIYSMEKAQ